MTGVSLLVALTGTTLAWLVLPVRRAPAALAVVGPGGRHAAPAARSSCRPRRVQPAARSPSPPCRATSPATGLDVPRAPRRSPPTTCALTEQLAGATSRPASGRSPTSWCGRRTPRPSTPSTTPASTPASSRPRTRSACRSSSGRWPTRPARTRCSTRASSGARRLGGETATPSGTRCPTASTSPSAARSCPTTYGQLALIPRDMARGTSLEPLRVGGALVADAICFDVAYDDVHPRPGRPRRRAGHGADQQRDVHPHRPDRPAVRDQPAAGGRDRALRRGGRHQRRLGHRRPRRQRGRPVPRPRTQDGAASRTSRWRTASTPAVRLGAWPGRAAWRSPWLGVALALVPYRRRCTHPTAGDRPEGHGPWRGSPHEHRRARPRRDGHPDLQRGREPRVDRGPAARRPARRWTSWWSTTGRPTAPGRSPTGWPPPTRRSRCCTAPRRPVSARRTSTASGSPSTPATT